MQPDQEVFDNKKKIEGISSLAKRKVKLNIGGKIFTTSLDTLTKEKDSMLASMFGGNFTIAADEDGEIFIDRSPQHFGVILNYLRTGLFPPRNMYNPFDYTTLQAEVEYYGISSLSSLFHKTKTFVYQYDFDNNGLLYWIGTSKGSKPYTNPAPTLITVTRSSIGDNNLNFASLPEIAAGRESKSCYTHNIIGSWYCFNLQPFNICPNYYTLRHWCNQSYALRNWIFQGSTDGAQWEDLVVHVNDTRLSEDGGSTASWMVPDKGKWFSHFMILQTGPNSSGNNYLMLSVFEVYGILEEESQ